MKIMILLKRKPEITAQGFRDHYETSHVALAYKHLGHLFADYRRNYAQPMGEAVGEDPNPAFVESQYDAIAEIWLKDDDAWLEMQRLTADRVIGKIFMGDEEHFLDRAALRIFPCDEVLSKASGRRVT